MFIKLVATKCNRYSHNAQFIKNILDLKKNLLFSKYLLVETYTDEKIYALHESVRKVLQRKKYENSLKNFYQTIRMLLAYDDSHNL